MLVSHWITGGSGAESPRDIGCVCYSSSGLSGPQTQIPVYDRYGQLVAVIDMGWAGIKVGVDYEAMSPGPTAEHSTRTSSEPKR